MDVALQAAEDSAPEGLVICAEEQTAGRGRRGRTWASPPGAGCYFSIVLRPPSNGPNGTLVLSSLTLMAGVAVRDAVACASGVKTDLKWPNDLTINSRKLAGILAEGRALGTPQQSVVIGVGVNVLRASYPADVADRATSIETAGGRRVAPSVLLDAILIALTEWYDRLRAGNADDILRAWRERSPSACGSAVELVGRGKRGITAGIDDSGALLVETDAGTERIIAGELRWR